MDLEYFKNQIHITDLQKVKRSGIIFYYPSV